MIKKSPLLLIVFFFTAVGNLNDSLDELIKKVPAHVGIKVVSIKTKETLYEHNASKLFLPASNTKLCTAIAALSLLGSSLDTVIATDGYQEQEVLRGNLYLRGDGDPLLTTGDLERFALALKKKGISAIEGDLVIDDTVFDSINYGPGWMWDDGPYFYHSPVNGIPINHNCIKVKVKPDKEEQPSVLLELPTSYVKIMNTACSTEPNYRSSLDDKILLQ